jgi:hypothetical protein
LHFALAGSGFAAGVLYEHNAANSAWTPISVVGTNAAQGDLVKHNDTGLTLGTAFFGCSANAGSAVANPRFACGFYIGDTPFSDNAAGFGFRIVDAGNFVAVNGNGVSSTTTDTGVADGLKNLLAIQTSTEIKFYIDGV